MLRKYISAFRKNGNASSLFGGTYKKYNNDVKKYWIWLKRFHAVDKNYRDEAKK